MNHSQIEEYIRLGLQIPGVFFDPEAWGIVECLRTVCLPNRKFPIDGGLVTPPLERTTYYEADYVGLALLGSLKAKGIDPDLGSLAKSFEEAALEGQPGRHLTSTFPTVVSQYLDLDNRDLDALLIRGYCPAIAA